MMEIISRALSHTEGLDSGHGNPRRVFYERTIKIMRMPKKSSGPILRSERDGQTKIRPTPQGVLEAALLIGVREPKVAIGGRYYVTSAARYLSRRED